MADSEQKKLREFIKRRHPEYAALVEHWEFCEATYKGGREWFDANIFPYVKEGPKAFAERVQRAYRFNHTREVVDLVDKYLFKMEINRNEAEAPESVKKFWKAATLSGQSIKDFMKMVSNRASIFGRPWIVVDTNKRDDVRTRAEERDSGARTYAYLVSPMNVLDMSYDELGDLRWVLIHEIERDDEDPIESSGAERSRFRLWERESSTLFTVEKRGRETIVIKHPPVEHNLGVVPVIPADNIQTDEKYSSPAMIADVAYLDRACANYLSNLDAIIQDQTFSQLALPTQGLSGEEDARAKLIEMGTKAIFTYDGENGAKPFYLSPDPSQAELILKAVNKIINEIYHSIGLAGERTKEDNALGIDNSSGVAKAYDFERVNSLLAAKADSLETVENRLVALVAKWNGEEVKVTDKRLVSYPDSFDVRGLYDEFEIAARLALLEAPDELRREQMERVIDKLFPQLPADKRRELTDALKGWPPPLLLEGGESSGPDALKRTNAITLSNQLVKGNGGKV